VKGQTADGDAVVLVAEGDRLAITVPRERLSDIFELGPEKEKIGDYLTAAATLSS
jgi:hypothetical protein